MRRVLLRPRQGVADQELHGALLPEKLHALRRHPADVGDVADLVPLGSEKKAVGDVVLSVQHRKGRNFQSANLAMQALKGVQKGVLFVSLFKVAEKQKMHGSF